MFWGRAVALGQGSPAITTAAVRRCRSQRTRRPVSVSVSVSADC